jgi:hypothetical protein
VQCFEGVDTKRDFTQTTAHFSFQRWKLTEWWQVGRCAVAYFGLIVAPIQEIEDLTLTIQNA